MADEEDRQKELARAVKEFKRVVEEESSDEDHIVRGTD